MVSLEIQNNMLEHLLNPFANVKRGIRRALPILLPFAIACGGDGKGKLAEILSAQPSQPSQPASTAKYEDSGNRLTDSRGEVTLTYPSGLQRIRIRNRNGQGIPDINVRGASSLDERVVFYYDTTFLKDARGTEPGVLYKPGFKIIPTRARKPGELQTPDLEEITMDFVQDMPVFGLSMIEFIKNPPRWDKDKITRFPVQYQGNWTFTQLKEANTILRNSAALITIATVGGSGPGTIPIAAVTAKVGVVLDFADFILALVKENTGYDFDRNRAFEVYHLQGTIAYFFIPTNQFYRGYTNNIKNYNFLTPPNRLYYLDQNGKARALVVGSYIEGGQISKDKFLIRQFVGGIPGFTSIIEGFRDNGLYIYGADNPEGEVLAYNPPILVGDDAIDAGKTYTTYYTIAATAGPNKGATQNARHTFTWLGRETVKVHTGIYTDCWKARESLTIAGTTITNEHWFVKGIGAIRTITADGKDMRLYYAQIGASVYRSDK